MAHTKWTRINGDYRTIWRGLVISVEKTRDGGWNWWVRKGEHTQRNRTVAFGESAYLAAAKTAALEAAERSARP